MDNIDWSSIVAGIQEYKFYIGFFLFFFVAYAIVMIIMHNRKKAANNKFLTEHPDAAQIFLLTHNLMVSENVTVVQVNGGHAHTFRKKGKVGVYVPAGTSELDVDYSHQRHTGRRSTVTQTTGIVKKIVETEPNGCYMLGFNRKTNSFTFEKYIK